MYKPHLESLALDQARANDWLDYLDEFNEWERFIPDIHIKQIKMQKGLPRKDRITTGFDNKFLISVLRSINEKKYDIIVSLMSEARLTKITIKT